MSIFGDLNKIEILGNITQDPELRYTANGTPVTNFGVATNRSYKSGEEWKEEVTFHNIVVWSTDAEMLTQRARKGTRIYVQGRIQTRSWDDNQGQKQYRTEIVAERVILLDRYDKSPSEELKQKNGVSTNEPSKNSQPVKELEVESETKKDEDVIDPDDLPF